MGEKMINRLMERVVTGFSWICAMVLLGTVLCILGYLLVNGFGTLNGNLIFGGTDPVDALLFRKQVFDGLFPAMVGTFTLVTLQIG